MSRFASLAEGNGAAEAEGQFAADAQIDALGRLQLSPNSSIESDRTEAEQLAASAPVPRQRSEVFPQAIVWIDLEMTGLDPDRDHILQVACLVTSGKLDLVAQGPEIAIHHPDAVLASMNDWCIKHHGDSGLTQLCRESQTTLLSAQSQVLAFVQCHAHLPTQLAGNSVYLDLAFMKRGMPQLAECFHHRVIDVSSVAELARRWRPKEHRHAPRTRTAQKHTAMADIKSSLAELRYYQRSIFKPSA